MSSGVAPVPQVEVAAYSAPRVSVVAAGEMISSRPVEGADAPGGYQSVLLDTVTGALRFHESTRHLEPWDPAWKSIGDVPRETRDRWDPGVLFLVGTAGPHPWFEPVPRVLRWSVLASGYTPQYPYLSAEEANALLEAVVPHAQEVLDGLFEAAGELDWSAAAAHAARNVARLTDRSGVVPAVADADLVDFRDIVRAFPQVYSPEMFDLSLDGLARACETQTRFLGSWYPEVKKLFGRPHHDGSGVRLDVLGVRSWYRTALLGGDPRPTRDFAGWEDGPGRLAADADITSDSADLDLDEWIAVEEARAARQGVRLLGARDTVYRHRDRLRASDWERLAVVGAEISRLEKLRAERTRLVQKGIGWGRTDLEISEQGHMTRQGVHLIRARKAEAARPPV
ncbi:hypothetical protein [Streptomyces sp. NPDC087294]|uniref:hypothetical protein n=1 Tax=Streptomyces sp. NPDC087294 TaxID=3365777 RepID=UPI0038029989